MRSRADGPSVSWITSNEALADAVSRWGTCLTLDTEFVRTNTYYPMPGLYQVGSGDAVYLLDPLAISAWQPFQEVLRDPQVVKVMHACQEDSELIHHHLGVTLQGVFDTQFAHAFVSDEFSLSYANLVERRLDIRLGKHETRSDWLARPLTDQQLEYAVEDVTFLEPLYDELRDELQAQGKWSWFSADMTSRATYAPVEPMHYYRNVKKAWHLSPAELARLQAFCAWREETARQENVPRNRVVWDEHLYTFATYADEPLTRALVREALPRVVADRYEGALLELSATASVDTPAPLPRPLNAKQSALIKKMRAAGVAAAAERKMAPELICRKRDLEACVRHYLEFESLPADFGNWRDQVVGEQFTALLEGAEL